VASPLYNTLNFGTILFVHFSYTLHIMNQMGLFRAQNGQNF